MPGCPSEAEVLAFVEGDSPARARSELERHLTGCDECRMLVSELARGGEHLGDEPEPARDLDPVERPRSIALGPVRPGDVLAEKYVVERVLGMGGMGVVVAAMHRDLAQRVALKFLLPAAFEAPGAQARMLREARSAARIQSEHVARVMDVGTLENGAPYLVIEYLDGVDLGVRLREGPLPVSLAVDLVLEACEALAEAHGLGIVHRDLKPANLFLLERPDGSPMLKVLDFGISKAESGSQATLTTQTATMGSPRYMSPEQLRSARDVDARADVWSLGIILFELVTGKAPFEGDSILNVCAAIANEEPPLLRKVRADAPEVLERVIRGCLEKDRSARISSVAALARALRPIASRSGRTSIERIERIAERQSSPDLDDAKASAWAMRAPRPRTSTIAAVGALSGLVALAAAFVLRAPSPIQHTEGARPVEILQAVTTAAPSSPSIVPSEPPAAPAATARESVAAVQSAAAPPVARPRPRRVADGASSPAVAQATANAITNDGPAPSTEARSDGSHPNAKANETSPLSQSGLLERK